MADIAHQRNREDRLKFNVVCDLTTAVHIGDLVEVDRTNLTKPSWRVVELKEGKMNAVLSSTIEEQGGSLSEQDFDDTVSGPRVTSAPSCTASITLASR